VGPDLLLGEQGAKKRGVHRSERKEPKSLTPRRSGEKAYPTSGKEREKIKEKTSFCVRWTLGKKEKKVSPESHKKKRQPTGGGGGEPDDCAASQGTTREKRKEKKKKVGAVCKPGKGGGRSVRISGVKEH